MQSKLKQIKDKLFSSREALVQKVNEWKNAGETIVFTNGCFDLLHQGHVDYLFRAADLGNRLIIGVNTDQSVSRLKGPHRPIKDEESRALILAALACSDAIILFGEETPLSLIQAITPDILVKGADYEISQIVGADHVLNNGGKVDRIPFLEGFSTSLIEQKIKNK